MTLRQFRYYTSWHHVANEKNYEVPADPWKQLRVDPSSVEFHNGEIKLNWGLGRIESGEWDRESNCTFLKETAIYTGLKQRFEEGYNWEKTALYREAKEQFEEGESFRGYESLEAYRSVRCEHVDELFRSIQRDGYRPNEAATHEKPPGENSFEDAYVHHLEPLVVIGRGGEIYWAEGHHRLIISAILEVEEIPVYVLCRHHQWQQVRDRIADVPRSEIPSSFEDHLDHPDLRDVLA